MLGEDYEVLETYKGKDLEFKEYEPLYDCSVPLCEKQHKKAYYVVCADYVTLTDGTASYASHLPLVRMMPTLAASTTFPLCSWWTPRAI